MTISKRIESIDILRGIVMIIMCLDHTRDYYQDLDAAGWPMDMETTTPALFFTRYITHFCAPIFIFLSGVSAYLQSKRKSKKELSIFLLTRGVWLIFLELALNNYLWFFDIGHDFVILQVIWAIGASMVVLAGVIHLNKHVILLLGIAIVAGHNLLDTYNIDQQSLVAGTEGAKEFMWYIFHQQGGFNFADDTHFIGVMYPMMPWLGVMILGYSAGRLYGKNNKEKDRFRVLLSAGVSALILFALLRSFNIYGDLYWQFEAQDSLFKSIVSFLRITKYPPSFQFVLVTIGVCMIALAFLERMKNKMSDFFLVFGRVPLFFYFLHIAVIHLSSMLLKPLYGDSMYSSVNNFENREAGANMYLGTSLWQVYLVWIIIIAVLYYPCYKYMIYKSSNRDKKWLSYL